MITIREAIFSRFLKVTFIPILLAADLPPGPWLGGGLRSCRICRASHLAFRRSSNLRRDGGVCSGVFGSSDLLSAFFPLIPGGEPLWDRSGESRACDRTRR